MKLFYFFLSSSLLLAGCGGGGGSGDDGAKATSSNAANSAVGSTSAAAASGNGTSSGNATSSANSTAMYKPGTMTCGSPSTSGATASSTLVSADTPNAQSGRLFASGTSFPLAFVTNASVADTLQWSVADQLGNVAASGTVPVAAGAVTTSLSCTSTLAGYFAVSATLAKSGGQVPSAGTRPTGSATFGVLPNLSGIVPAVTYARQDLHRFGMQGENDNGHVLAALGMSWTFDNRELSAMEPNGPNTFNPNANNLDPFYTTGNVMRLIHLDGIPAWASPTGASEDESLPPTDLGYYTNYMTRVGQESNIVRNTYFPNQSANYYQVTWEPDASWQGTNAQFVQLYQAEYQGLHAGDPHAVVMGPTDTAAVSTANQLKALAPLGFSQYIDGVTTHGYYDSQGTAPSTPPERYATDPSAQPGSLIAQMRGLRTEMANDYKPGMKLFSTEVGISYDNGTSYGPNYPTANVLFAQGAVVARTHLIILGEGADQTWVFYGADFPGLVGYGTFFDLNDPQGAYGAQNISPKPAAMAVAAMTRILDGTNTLGPVNGTPSGVYAYAFQQLNSGAVITALWTHNNSVWSASTGFSSTYSVAYSLAVDAPGTSGTVTVLDVMGNPTSMNYSNGTLQLNLTESPVYVVSNNASVASANSTLPTGYQPD